MVHCWCCTFYAFVQMCNMCSIICYYMEYFHCRKSPLCFAYLSPNRQCLTATDIFFDSIVLFSRKTFDIYIVWHFSGCHIARWITFFTSRKLLLLIVGTFSEMDVHLNILQCDKVFIEVMIVLSWFFHYVEGVYFILFLLYQTIHQYFGKPFSSF